MHALKHIMNGDTEKARALLESIPEMQKMEALEEIATGAATLSEMARDLQGNRAQRRAVARAEAKAARD